MPATVEAAVCSAKALHAPGPGRTTSVTLKGKERIIGSSLTRDQATTIVIDAFVLGTQQRNKRCNRASFFSATRAIMTRAACALIIHISTLRLTWRSVKYLKIPSQEMDIEILQLWSLLSFHCVYSRSLEWFLSYLPLYYYAKMILLAVTFLPGTRIPNVLFETLLVPAIERIHCVMDVDINSWILYQGGLLPFRMVDLLLLPGILSSDREAKRRLRADLEEVRLRKPLVLKSGASEITLLDANANSEVESQIEPLNLPMDEHGTDPHVKTVSPPLHDIPRRSKVKEKGKCIAKDADIRARRVELEKWRAAKTLKEQKKLLDGSKLNQNSPLEANRRIKSSRKQQPPAYNHPKYSSLSQNMASCNTTTPKTNNSNKKSTESPRSQRITRQSNSTSSPVARSRMVATSTHLRRFSRDHKVLSSSSQPHPKKTTNVTSRRTGRRKIACDSIVIQSQEACDVGRPPLSPLPSSTSTGPITKQYSPSTVEKSDPKNEIKTSGGKKRRSLGNQIRILVTGDVNIRVRDYLFDLDTPSLPSPVSTTEAGFVNSHDHQAQTNENGATEQEEKAVCNNRPMNTGRKEMRKKDRCKDESVPSVAKSYERKTLVKNGSENNYDVKSSARRNGNRSTKDLKRNEVKKKNNSRIQIENSGSHIDLSSHVRRSKRLLQRKTS